MCGLDCLIYGLDCLTCSMFARKQASAGGTDMTLLLWDARSVALTLLTVLHVALTVLCVALTALYADLTVLYMDLTVLHPALTVLHESRRPLGGQT